MTSKDCLDLLMFNQKKVKNGFEFINLKTKERATIENCYEIIKKDLEALEIIKKYSFVFVKDGELYCGRLGDIEQLLDEDDFDSNEEYELLKECFEDE